MQIKEDFCPACLAVIPMAFGAFGTATNSNETVPQHELQHRRKRNKMIQHISIAILIISVLVFVYFKFIKKCESCR